MTDCIFCKIAKKEINTPLLEETPSLVAFKDIAPQAAVHALIIPKAHVVNLDDWNGKDSLLNEMFQLAQKVARDLGISKSGYRTVMNSNQQGGQTVYHMHLHVMGGEQLGGNMSGI